MPHLWIQLNRTHLEYQLTARQTPVVQPKMLFVDLSNTFLPQGKGKSDDGHSVDLESGVGIKGKQKFGDIGPNHIPIEVESARAKINIEQLSIKEELFTVRFIVHKAR